MSNTCIIPACIGTRHSRGLCMRCYTFLRNRMKVVSVLTWPMLEQAELSLSKVKRKPPEPSDNTLPLEALGKAGLLHVDDVIEKWEKSYGIYKTVDNDE